MIRIDNTEIEKYALEYKLRVGDIHKEVRQPCPVLEKERVLIARVNRGLRFEYAIILTASDWLELSLFFVDKIFYVFARDAKKYYNLPKMLTCPYCRKKIEGFRNKITTCKMCGGSFIA